MREPTTRRLLFRSPQPEAGDATGISSLVLCCEVATCSLLSAGTDAASAMGNKFATSNGKSLWASEGKGRPLGPRKRKFLCGISGVRRSREYRTRPRIKCYGPHRGRGGTPPGNLLLAGLPTISARTLSHIHGGRGGRHRPNGIFGCAYEGWLFHGMI